MSEKIKLTDGTILEYSTISENISDKTLAISFEGKTYEEVKEIFSNKTLLSSIEVLNESDLVISLMNNYNNLVSITVTEQDIKVTLKQATLEARVAELEAKIAELTK